MSDNFSISLSFSKDFSDELERLYLQYGEEIFAIQGIANKHLDIAKFSKNFFGNSASVSKVSVDGNANVREKNVTQYTQENNKAIMRLNSLYMMFKTIKKMFSLEDAKKALEKVINGEIFVNDLHSYASMPYCYAFDLRKLLMDGMDFFKGNMVIRPPKRSDSFIDLLIQTTAYISNQIVGACSYPDVFLVLNYFYEKEMGVDYLDALSKEHEYKIRNQFQNLIYSLNYPFRGSQSAFTNVSIMDMGFLESLFKEYVFPDFTTPNLRNVYELSKLFFEYFSDINSKEGVFTFPVTTLAISLDEKGEYLDPEFVKWASVANAEKCLGNIFQDVPTSFSSCCFDGKQEVSIKYKNVEMYAPFNELYSLFDNDTCVEVYHQKDYKKAKLIAVPRNGKKMFNILLQFGIELNVTEDHLHPVKTAENKKFVDMVTTDLRVGYLIKYFDECGIYTELPIISIKEYESTDEYVYCFEMEDQNDPYFTLPNGVITHNCRLRNDFTKIAEAGYQNSFGVSGISIGSHRVSGLNLPRIALLEEGTLEEDIEICHKILLAHRKILKRLISNGFLPLYTYGWIHLNKQYSTVGLLGAYEYVKNLGKDIRTEDGLNILTSVLKKIEDHIVVWQEQEKKEKHIYNIEQIPAESMAVRLADCDHILGFNTDSEGNKKYELYSNQYLPLIEDAHIFDRLRLQGHLDNLTSGGAICHINIDDEHFKDQSLLKLMDDARKLKVKYFAVNRAFSECEDSHFSIGRKERCPTCNKPIIQFYTRTVGFVTPVKAWIPVRQDYEFPRRKFYNNDEATR